MKKVQNTRQLVATLLALLIFLQPIAAIAAVNSSNSTTLTHSNTDAVPYRAAPDAPPVPQSSSFGVELTALNTAFNNHAGIDYHQRTRKVVVSANSTLGQPNNFELIQADGTHTNFSNLSGVSGELKLATARDDGFGLSIAGFKPGELFTTTDTPAPARCPAREIVSSVPSIASTATTALCLTAIVCPMSSAAMASAIV